MRIRDWSSDVCSSDLTPGAREVLEILDLRIVCVEQHRQADERPDAAHVDTAARFGTNREQRAGAAAGEVDIAGEQRVGDRPAAAQLHHLKLDAVEDRKSTRLNSSHQCASGMSFSLCKKKNNLIYYIY